jgi:hypothetical protein
MESLSKRVALKIIVGGAVTFILSLLIIFFDLFNLYSKAAGNSPCANGNAESCNFGFNEIVIRIGQVLFILGFTGIILYSIKAKQHKN